MSKSSGGPAVTLTLTQANYPNHNQSFNTTDLGTSYGAEEISAGEVAYITGVPEMPDLSASLSGLTGSDSVDWRMEIRSERTERGTADDKDYPSTGTTTTSGTGSWDITAEFGTDFVGGKATIYYKVNGAPEKSFQFFIRGKNPLDATALNYVQSHSSAATYPYAWGMVQHESRQGNRVFNQFNSGGDGPAHLETPNFGGPNGWGIAKLDNPLGANATTLRSITGKRTLISSILNLMAKRPTLMNFSLPSRTHFRAIQPLQIHPVALLFPIPQPRIRLSSCLR